MKQNYDLKHRKVFNVWQESFDLGQIPNGIVVWKHGVVGTETNFANADSTSRYKLFDVGILTEYGVVHRIRVPYYVIGLFKGYINFRGEVKKKEPKKKPKPEFFTYPKGKKGNNEKII